MSRDCCYIGVRGTAGLLYYVERPLNVLTIADAPQPCRHQYNKGYDALEDAAEIERGAASCASLVVRVYRRLDINSANGSILRELLPSRL